MRLLIGIVLTAATIVLITLATAQAQNDSYLNKLLQGSVFKNLTAWRNYLLHKDILRNQQFMNNGSDPNFYCKFHGTSHGLVYCPPSHSHAFLNSTNQTG